MQNSTMTFNPEQQLFAKSAWLLYNNRERILSDPRMAYTPIDMHNGLMYIKDPAFPGATIGVYVEWWDLYVNTLHTDEEGVRWLMVHFHGSPLSSMNWCKVVSEDGTIKDWHADGFASLWHGFDRLCKSFCKRKEEVVPYTLEEVISKLSQ